MEQHWEDEAVLGSEYFRMFEFKIKRCPRAKPHDWTQCPFAHPTEKAKRRNPTKYRYNGTACADFRKNGSCRRGDACPFAHGVFEAWLHPARYRTKLCTDGDNCTRRVCFFAHSEAEKREATPDSLTDVVNLREELLAELQQVPEYAEQLERLFNCVPPPSEDEHQELQNERRATTLDLLRELQSQRRVQMINAPGRPLMSSLPQLPTTDLEDELLRKLAIRQAAQEELLSGHAGAQSARMSLDMLGNSSSLSSMDAALMASRLNSLAALSPQQQQQMQTFSKNWATFDGAGAFFNKHGGLAEQQGRESEDWMSITMTPNAPSNRSSSDTISPWSQHALGGGNGFGSYIPNSGQHQVQHSSHMRLEDLLTTGSMSSNHSDGAAMQMQNAASLFSQPPNNFTSDQGYQMRAQMMHQDNLCFHNMGSQLPPVPDHEQEAFMAMLAQAQQQQQQQQEPNPGRNSNISEEKHGQLCEFADNFVLAPARLPSATGNNTSGAIPHNPSVDKMLLELPRTLADLA